MLPPGTPSDPRVCLSSYDQPSAWPGVAGPLGVGGGVVMVPEGPGEPHLGKPSWPASWPTSRCSKNRRQDESNAVGVSPSARVAVTKSHRLGDEPWKFISSRFRRREVQDKCAGGLARDESLPPGSQIATFLLGPRLAFPTVCTSVGPERDRANSLLSSHKDTGAAGSGPHH